MIKILDYGMGNTASMLNIIHKAGGNAEIASNAKDLDNSYAIILPGVGSFDNGINKLYASGFLDALSRIILNQNVPFLGVCLGMQLLFSKSEEGKLPGLGWVDGNVTRFDFSNTLQNRSMKIPHMGWNTIKPTSYENVYAGLEEEARFYFVHSYHVNCNDSSDILATANYGYEFTCSIRHNNISGVQFHPEKSHCFGVRFFKNYLEEIYRA